MPSRKITDLTPRLRPLAAEFVRQCQVRGVQALITCTWRAPIEQRALYAQGRTAPGPKVTWTLESKHTKVTASGKPDSHAFDVVPVISGKAVWDAKDPAWEIIGTVARALGLVWGGDWKKGRDMPHIELAG